VKEVVETVSPESLWRTRERDDVMASWPSRKLLLFFVSC